MTPEIALDYIARRMREMGHKTEYLLRFRHLLLRPSEARELTAYGQILLLIEPSTGVRIDSDVGLFDVNEDSADEVQYEHRGLVRVKNLSLSPTSVRFLQAIPLNPTRNADHQ